MGVDLTEQVHQVVDEIKTYMGSLIGTRVYVGLYDRSGNKILEEDALSGFREFITSFVKTNFNLLEVEDHSLPLSGHGIIFFKINDDMMIVLYIMKGKVGQLLAFKSRMGYFSEKFTEILETSSEMSEKGDALAYLEETVAPSGPRFLQRDMGIKPVLKKKMSGKERFDINEAKIFPYYNGETSISQIKFENLDLLVDDLIFKHVSNKIIDLGDFQIFEVSCPECKAKHYFYISKFIKDIAKDTVLKKQISNENICPHTFLIFFDKKSKIKTKPLEKLSKVQDQFDMSQLNLANIVNFFGQDVLFLIFHAFLFKKRVMFLVDNEELAEVFKFWRNIFPTITNKGPDKDFIIMPENEFNKKLYSDTLVIDFNSNFVLREPFEPELDFEKSLYKKLLRVDEQKQILFLNHEIERILGLTDNVIEIITPFEEITEERLVEKLSEKGFIVELKEIPIIKILAEIYYNDSSLFKKIKKTVVGKMSEFLSAI